MTTFNRILIFLLILTFPCISYSRYYDSRIGKWITPDPILNEYLPNPLDKRKQSNQFIPERDLPGQGGVYDPVNINLYHYAGNNPLKYIDPDGLLKRGASGGLIFWQPKNTESQNIGGINIVFYSGYLKADDGSIIWALRIADPGKNHGATFDCHGFTFGDGQFWINSSQVEGILKGDNYQKHDTPTVGDIAIFRATDKTKGFTESGKVGDIWHSAKVIGVDLKKGTFTVQEKMGNKEGIQERTYQIKSSESKIEFYSKKK